MAERENQGLKKLEVDDMVGGVARAQLYKSLQKVSKTRFFRVTT